MSRTSMVTAGLFGLFTAYAALRYHIFKEVSWQHFPAFVLNKSICWTGLTLIGLSRVSHLREHRKTYGLLGLGGIVLHVPLSLATLNRGYHERLFESDSLMMTWNAELSLLAGAGSLMCLLALWNAFLQKVSSDPPGEKLISRLGRLVLILAAIHIAAIGYPTWLAPAAWYGYLPPITLWSCLTAMVLAFWPNRSV